jgi:hypothetical protein
VDARFMPRQEREAAAVAHIPNPQQQEERLAAQLRPETVE